MIWCDLVFAKWITVSGEVNLRRPPAGGAPVRLAGIRLLSRISFPSR
jgi:hypothetical protein